MLFTAFCMYSKQWFRIDSSAQAPSPHVCHCLYSCSHLSYQIVLVIITKILVSRWCNCRKCWNTRLRGCTETSFCSWQALSKIMVYELYKMPFSDLNLSNEYSVVWLNYLSHLSSLPYHLSVFLTKCQIYYPVVTHMYEQNLLPSTQLS